MKLKEILPPILPSEPCCLLNGFGTEHQDYQYLNIELYPPLIFVTLFQEKSNDEVAELTIQLQELYPQSPLMIQDRWQRPAVLRSTSGEIPREMVVTENNLQFLLHPERGQNLGFFPDMRRGRRLIGDIIGQLSAESNLDEIRVLNLFSYTCALSVSALAAGASKVVNIDKNKRSLDIGRRNHRLNHQQIPGGYQNQALFLPHDIFKSLGKLKREGPYHLIIADPPPSQKGSFDLNRDYPRLLRRLPEMLHPQGHLMLTMNHPGKSWEDLEGLVQETLPASFAWKRLPPPEDYQPRKEGRGLKIIWA